MKITPEVIKSLGENDIYVFPTDESGMHKNPKALHAIKFGARVGQGYGPSGQTFAIPIKSWGYGARITPPTFLCYIARLYGYALMHPEKNFLVPRMDEGDIQLEPAKLANFLGQLATLPNISLDKVYADIIGGDEEEEEEKDLIKPDF